MSFNLLKPKYKRKRLRRMNYTLLSVVKCASNINISRWLTIYNKDYLWNTVRSSSRLQLRTNTIYCFNLSCSCKCGILYPNTVSAGREKVNELLLLAQDYKVHRKESCSCYGCSTQTQAPLTSMKSTHSWYAYTATSSSSFSWIWLLLCFLPSFS